MKTAEEIVIERFGEGAKLSLTNIVGLMETYADQFKPVWIDVNEQLPEAMQDVTLFDASYKKVHQGYYWGYDEEYETHRFYARDFVINGIVTHWQPLPEPPISKNRIQYNQNNREKQ